MSNTNTGGPAFPTSEERFSDGVLNHEATYGMTLRDYFAGLAMQGLLASNVEAPIERFAAKSYEMADAMLKVRNFCD